jgi:hypothetical protein
MTAGRPKGAFSVLLPAGNKSDSAVFVFSELERSAIVAVLPNPLAASTAEIEWEREALEWVASAYLNLTHHHRRRNAEQSPTKRWKRIRKMIVADIARAEKAGAIASILSDLHEDLRHAYAAVEGYGVLGQVHQGRGNPARDWLYDAALGMWKRLGGHLTVSRRSYGTKPASGAMIDFMIAVLTPIMKDDAPGAEAIAKFVKTKKKRKARAPRRLAGSKLF